MYKCTSHISSAPKFPLFPLIIMENKPSDLATERLRREYHSRWFDEKRLVLITPKGSRHLHISRRFQLTCVWVLSAILMITATLGATSLLFYTEQEQLAEKTRKVEQDLQDFSQQLQSLKQLDTTDPSAVLSLPDGHTLQDNYVSQYIETLHQRLSATTQFTSNYMETYVDYLTAENEKIRQRLASVHRLLPKFALTAVDKSLPQAVISTQGNTPQNANLPTDALRAEIPVEKTSEPDSAQQESVQQAVIGSLAHTPQQAVDALITNKSYKKFLTLLPTHYPLTEYWVSSTFGARRHPVTGRLQEHKGIDLVAQRRTKIRTTRKGVVTFAGPTKVGGNMVFVRHAGNIETRYGHLQKILVKRGQTLEQGNAVGLLGSSGFSTGPHVHYEILVNGIYIDPAKVKELATPISAEPNSKSKK